MKITAVSVIRLQGVLDYEGEFWEERLVRPLDIYPEHKAQGPHEMFAVGEGRYNISAYFVEVETDEGVAGRGGPLPIDQAFVIQTQLAPLLYRSRTRWPPNDCGTGCTEPRYMDAKARR